MENFNIYTTEHLLEMEEELAKTIKEREESSPKKSLSETIFEKRRREKARAKEKEDFWNPAVESDASVYMKRTDTILHSLYMLKDDLGEEDLGCKQFVKTSIRHILKLREYVQFM